MLVEAFVGWVVQEIGSAGVRAGARAVLGSPEDRTLRRALTVAVNSVVREAPENAREPLEGALRERFADAPAIASLDPGLELGEAFTDAIRAQIAPLADAGATGDGVSFLAHIGVAAEPLATAITDAFFAALRRLTASSDASTLALMQEVEAMHTDVRGLHRSLQPVPTIAHDSLPRDTTDFTDRADALGMITRPGGAAAGGGTPVIAVSGMAGVGKTAFAVHAAHKLAPHYPDLRLFVNLHAHTADRAPVAAAAALETLLRALGLTARQIPESLDERAALWRSQLSGKRALVLLDNAASPSQVRPLLPASAGCLVIVTSRRRFDGLEGAHAVSLDVLPPDEAVELFHTIAGTSRSGDEPGDAARAVALCGHLPLAIRMAAARLRRHPSWGIRDLAGELSVTRDQVVGSGPGETGVRTAFELSYQALPPDQRRVFRRLGLHTGHDFGVQAAAALDGTDARAVRPVLDELYDQYLIDERGYGRFVQHDLLHEYARRLADEEETPEDRSAATDRLIAYYTAAESQVDRVINLLGHRDEGIPEAPVPGMPRLTTHAEAMAWAETERANLHACLEIALDTGRTAQAIRLGRVMAYHLRLGGHWTEALTMYGRLAEVGRAAWATADAAYMWFLRADILRLLGRGDEALRWYTRALDAYQDIGDRHQEARTQHSIGDIERAAGRHDAALERYDAALAVYREQRNRHAQARGRHSIADTYRMAGRRAEALRAYDDLAVLYDELGDDPVGAARVRYGKAELHRAADSHDDAITEGRPALDAFRELGDRQGEADALRCLGGAYIGLGDRGQGLAHLRQALVLLESLGSPDADAVRDEIGGAGG